jgi:3-hydroxymyristoyl/3-hydroxydecanoyl-(acyl carrier protein) dehydratase
MEKVNLGYEMIQLLIPQRRPFLMIDRIVEFEIEPSPRIICVKNCSANESFFDGHYPSLAIMPGALTFEGMGQAANALAAICTLHDCFVKSKEDPSTLASHLKNLQFGYSLNKAYRPKMASQFESIVCNRDGNLEFGMVGATTLKFLEPVFAGSVIEYHATLTTIVDRYMHFDVETVVDNTVKAKGTLSTIKGLGVQHHLGHPKGV